MFVISFIAFAVQSKLGDPVAEMVAITASAEEKAAMRRVIWVPVIFLNVQPPK